MATLALVLFVAASKEHVAGANFGIVCEQILQFETTVLSNLREIWITC